MEEKVARAVIEAHRRLQPARLGVGWTVTHVPGLFCYLCARTVPVRRLTAAFSCKAGLNDAEAGLDGYLHDIRVCLLQCLAS